MVCNFFNPHTPYILILFSRVAALTALYNQAINKKEAVICRPILGTYHFVILIL